MAGTTQGLSGDGGPGTLAQISGPSALLLGAAGRLYVSELYNKRIRVLNP
ncbi:MAG: hypothetical protein AB7N76_12850 [Planctomycetota bacterium]